MRFAESIPTGEGQEKEFCLSEIQAFCFGAFEVRVEDHTSPLPPPHCPELDVGPAEKSLWRVGHGRMLPSRFLDWFRAVFIYSHKSTFWIEAEVTTPYLLLSRQLPPDGLAARKKERR